uniref:fatty acyl-CoA hydrolase precursor, medium chain-like isoform X2 n=1 Tax=Oncorhynchus gorbuscha TaxID=8017 RepID=UPI001EAE8DD6|nr:fatty acyl-CoA hydrolase precursor, medium chain-like isoform X2 [Oncorhynchus gorbuscha]
MHWLSLSVCRLTLGTDPWFCMSSGLFHKAISQSGEPLVSMFIQDDPKPAAQLVAQRAGCLSDDSAELMTCFSGLSPQDRGVATPALTKSFLGFPSILGINNHEYGWMLPHMGS